MTGYIGIDAGYASTGVAFMDKQVWLWRSKPDKSQLSAYSDINRIADFTIFLDEVFATIVGEYPCDKYVLKLEHFAPRGGNMSWNSLKTICINAVAISLATQYGFEIRSVTPVEIHRLAGGGTKEDTQNYVTKKFPKIANDIKQNYAKSLWEHYFDSVMIAMYPTVAPPTVQPKKRRKKK